MIDPGHAQAAEGVRWLIEQATATPGAVVDPVLRWVVVPGALLAAGVWACVRMASRWPDAVRDTRPVDPGLTAALVAGRVETPTVEMPRVRC